MSLEKNIMTALKEAMKSKDKVALEALRAIKSAILLEKTNGISESLTEADEMKLLQKLVKQRKDSADLYKEQGREDLAKPELAQAEVISQFLPKQLSEEEIKEEIFKIIQSTGASGMKDMGKVMQQATQVLAGKADGKTISSIVKQQLSK